MKVDRYFRLCRNMALQSPQRQRHGACLVKGGSVLSTGYNASGSNLEAFRHMPDTDREFRSSHRHAEVCCVSCLNLEQTTGSDLYVVRISKKETLAYSRPCPMCEAFLRSLGVKRVYYSITDTEFGVMKL